MNSFKSACSFAKSTPVSFNQFEEDVQSFLGRQIGIKLVVSRIGVFKSAENLSDSFHGSNSNTPARSPLRRLGS
jgi:hypothetical protein